MDMSCFVRHISNGSLYEEDGTARKLENKLESHLGITTNVFNKKFNIYYP